MFVSLLSDVEVYNGDTVKEPIEQHFKKLISMDYNKVGLTWTVFNYIKKSLLM